MNFNMLHDPWIMARRRSGALVTLRPWQITEGADGDDPIIRLASPRADFDGALVQLLIGLVQLTLAPDRDATWRRGLMRPPAPEELRQAFEPHAAAFNLGGDGARFMQDLHLDDPAETDIAALLIDSPGENALKRNTDHFVKRGRVQGMCPACAATALLTLQINAPSGGAGHRTSLRGGGPLTTLVLGATLWETVWANVLETDVFVKAAPDGRNRPVDIFPWLGPTRTSEAKTGQDTTPLHVHPAQAFWGMPRRIRLDLTALATGICDVCGSRSDALIQRYATRNYGTNYAGAWRHPLTPHSLLKDGLPNPAKGSASATLYRHWSGYATTRNEKVQPAEVVRCFIARERRQASPIPLLDRQARLWVFGYDMDNMKPLGWCEGAVPLHHVAEEVRPQFEEEADRLVAGALVVAGVTRFACARAMFRRPEDHRGEPRLAEERLWRETEEDFYRVLDDLEGRITRGGDVQDLKRSWSQHLGKRAEEIFGALSQARYMDQVDPRRIADALRWLRFAVSLNNPELTKALGLPPPPKPAKASKSKTAITP